MKSSGYWTFERCHEEALKYDCRLIFKKMSFNAYVNASKSKWLEQICSHMPKLRNSKNYWTFKRCQEEALKYTTRSKFQQGSCTAYSVSLKNKWMDEICVHMNTRINITFEMCQEIALMYDNRKDFEAKSKTAYNKAEKYKWLATICSHMKSDKKPFGYWNNFEKCLEEVLKYSNRTDFIKNASGVNKAIIRNGWSNIIFSHMIKYRNNVDRIVYAYEFSDNHVYVGLTGSPKTRKSQHINDMYSSMLKHMKKTGLEPLYIELTDFINENDASKMEGYFEEEYKQKGWNILNKIKTGGLGSTSSKWNNYNTCFEEALKYNTIKDFKINNSAAYDMIKRKGWKNVFSHMIKSERVPLNRDKDYNKCLEVALKYEYLYDFKKNVLIYNMAKRNNWLEKICSHFLGYVSIDSLKNEALLYKNKQDFFNGSRSLYLYANKNDLLDTICEHMIVDISVIKEWCISMASKYTIFKEFRIRSEKAYDIAKSNNWLDEICSHMIRNKKNQFTYEK